MRAFTLEELSTLSAEEAVTRQFDDLNFRLMKVWLAMSTVLFVLITSLALSRGGAAVWAGGLGVAGSLWFVLSVWRARGPRDAAEVAAWRRPPRELFRRWPRPAVLGVLATTFLLVFFGTVGTEPLAPFLVVTSFFVMAMRLRPAERVLAQGLPLLLSLAATLLGVQLQPIEEGSSGLLGGLTANVIFLLGLGLVINHRLRKRILALFDDEKREAGDRLRMRQELDYAREIQLSMLPEDCPPQGWLDICSHSTPATEVGGDYYDYFPLDGGRFAVVVGDVAGHGMASGLLLAGVRSCLTLLVEELDQPLAMLTKLNRMVRQTSRRRTLVTLAIVVLDPLSRKATVANAGHPPPMLARGGEVEEISLPSLPLGTELEPRFGQRELALAAGDLLLLHSDGLYEGVNEVGEPYGIERVAAALARVPPELAAAQARDVLLADFAAFTGEAAQRDDLTLVVIKVLAQPASRLAGGEEDGSPHSRG